MKIEKTAIPWRALTLVGALAVIWIAFSLATDGTFLSPRNLSLLTRQMCVTSLLAIGMVMVIVAGQIDLSVGAMAGLLGGVAAMAYVKGDWPLAVAFAATLALGALLGFIQGSLVAGAPVLYRVTVTNRGPSHTTNVVVTDILPPEIVPTGTIITNLGNIFEGASKSFFVSGSLASNKRGSLTNRASAASDVSTAAP